MSQWYGVARSNYVRIKNMEALALALDGVAVTFEMDGEGRVAFFGADEDSGGWPRVEVGDELEPFNPAVLICPHMVEGEVLVCMEVGFEKQRYVTGIAAAYSHDGRVCAVRLGDIYDKAAALFAVDVGSITVAED